MLAALILLAATSAATPAPTPAATPTPVKAATNDHPRTLADVAAERKLGIKGVKGGTFSATQSTVSPGTGNMTDADRWALEKGPPLHRNVSFVGVHTHEQFVYDGGIYVYFVDGKFSGGSYEKKD